MGFRFHSILWSLLIWGEVFAYTLLTQSEASPKHRSIPIVLLFATVLAFVTFIYEKGQEYKTILLFACWGWVASIAVFLRIWSVVDDTFLNIYITVTSILTSIVWCIVSHTMQISDGAWHWYIWSIILIIALCGAFNNKSEIAEQTYIVNTALLLVIQFVYAIYTIKHQTPGYIRCKHLWRIFSGTLIALALMIGSVLQKTETISYTQWEHYVVTVEVVVAVFIIADAIIGFKHQCINYEPVQTNDDTP